MIFFKKYCSSVVWLEIWDVTPPAILLWWWLLLLLFRIVSAKLGLWYFQMKLNYIFCLIHLYSEEMHCNFDENCTESVDCFC